MTETYYEIEFTHVAYYGQWKEMAWQSFIWIHPTMDILMPKHFETREEAVSYMDGLKGISNGKFKPLEYRVVKIAREVMEDNPHD